MHIDGIICFRDVYYTWKQQIVFQTLFTQLCEFVIYTVTYYTCECLILSNPANFQGFRYSILLKHVQNYSLRFNVKWYTEIRTSRVRHTIYYYIRFDNDFNLLYLFLYHLPNIYNKQYQTKNGYEWE